VTPPFRPKIVGISVTYGRISKLDRPAIRQFSIKSDRAICCDVDFHALKNRPAFHSGVSDSIEEYSQTPIQQRLTNGI